MSEELIKNPQTNKDELIYEKIEEFKPKHASFGTNFDLINTVMGLNYIISITCLLFIAHGIVFTILLPNNFFFTLFGVIFGLVYVFFIIFDLILAAINSAKTKKFIGKKRAIKIYKDRIELHELDVENNSVNLLIQIYYQDATFINKTKAIYLKGKFKNRNVIFKLTKTEFSDDVIDKLQQAYLNLNKKYVVRLNLSRGMAIPSFFVLLGIGILAVIGAFMAFKASNKLTDLYTILGFDTFLILFAFMDLVTLIWVKSQRKKWKN